MNVPSALLEDIAPSGCLDHLEAQPAPSMSVVLFIIPPGAGLRSEVRLIGSGKVYSGFSLVRTLAHGADLTNAARALRPRALSPELAQSSLTSCDLP